MENQSQLDEARVIWLFGLSGAGKSTIANSTASRLRSARQAVLILDGDDLRSSICRDLGFSVEDRLENVFRAAQIARLAYKQGVTVIAALMTPSANMRKLARSVVGDEAFYEVYVKCDIATCAKRDTKGLYAGVKAGTIRQLPGEDYDFEEPIAPDLVIDTNLSAIETCVEQLLRKIHKEQ